MVPRGYRQKKPVEDHPSLSPVACVLKDKISADRKHPSLTSLGQKQKTRPNGGLLASSGPVISEATSLPHLLPHPVKLRSGGQEFGAPNTQLGLICCSHNFACLRESQGENSSRKPRSWSLPRLSPPACPWPIDSSSPRCLPQKNLWTTGITGTSAAACTMPQFLSQLSRAGGP